MGKFSLHVFQAASSRLKRCIKSRFGNVARRFCRRFADRSMNHIAKSYVLGKHENISRYSPTLDGKRHSLEKNFRK